jgi:long-chain acyl-CoA synthetase
LDTPNVFTTLTQVFDHALKLSSDRKFLGHRPKVSDEPLKFANHYVWETYGQVDARRRAVGSAIHRMFQNGELGGGDYDTVGIWSQNRPGTC